MAIPFYLILGAAHSGRKTLLADLIEHGFTRSEHVVVYTASSEKLESLEGALYAREGTEKLEWRYDESCRILADPLNHEPAAIFFIADGYGDPIDLIEALSDWLQQRNLHLARVITIIDAQLLITHEADLKGWFDACLHFSDCALLTHTEKVSPKWLRAFSAHYQKELCYPCLLEVTKNCTVANPALVLDLQIRRMSLLFDKVEGSYSQEDTNENAQELPLQSLNKDVALFERLSDGRRKMALADIKSFLS